MSIISKLIVLLFLTFTGLTGAIASETSAQASSVDPVACNTISSGLQIFDRITSDGLPCVMSDKEMTETQGAFWLYAVRPIAGGMVGGLVGYTSYGSATGRWSDTGAVGALWGGFIGGAVGVYGGGVGSAFGGWTGGYLSNVVSQ